MDSTKTTGLFGPCSEGDFPLVFGLCFAANRPISHIETLKQHPSKIWDFFTWHFFFETKISTNLGSFSLGRGGAENLRSSGSRERTTISHLSHSLEALEFRDGKTVDSHQKKHEFSRFPQVTLWESTVG